MSSAYATSLTLPEVDWEAGIDHVGWKSSSIALYYSGSASRKCVPHHNRISSDFKEGKLTSWFYPGLLVMDYFVLNFGILWPYVFRMLFLRLAYVRVRVTGLS